MCKFDLTACNTLFCHPSRRKLTWTGQKTVSGQKTPLYAQLDYVLCKHRSVTSLQNSRAHGGATLVSDHKPVVAKVALAHHYLLFKKKTPAIKRYNCSTPHADIGTRIANQNAVRTLVTSKEYPSDPNKKLEELVNDIKECAEKTLGVAPVRTRRLATVVTSDPIITKLVAERRDLNLQLTSNATADRDETRREVKSKRKDIRRRLIDIENKKADDLAEEITSTDSTRRMFEANRILAGITRSNTITVHNSDGHEIHTDTGKADEAMRYFKQQLTEGVKEGLPAFIGEPQPLENPITSSEVSYAASRLKTNRASGPDNLQNELLKNADPCVYKLYAEAINDSFTTHTYITSIGEGIITPLQKPGKPKGPLSSLRPLTLLNGSRKILTLVTLKRIEQKLDDYTMAWQGGYKHGRSCADIVWAQRMLISVVSRKRWSYHKMGLDMSRAFDTVKRDTIINLLRDAGCSNDDIKLVQYLLSNTQLKVRVNCSLSEMFESLLGAFQGDSLSGKLFTLVLAAALHQLRAPAR